MNHWFNQLARAATKSIKQMARVSSLDSPTFIYFPFSSSLISGSRLRSQYYPVQGKVVSCSLLQ